MIITTSSTTSISSFSSSIIWDYWNSSSTAATVASSYTWDTWNIIQSTGTNSTAITESSIITSTSSLWTILVNDHTEQIRIRARELREQIERERIANEERQRQAAERLAIQQAAYDKAELLLIESLTPIQRLQLKRYGYFFVQGNKTGDRYRIRKGRAMNIDVMDGKRVKYRLCAHPAAHVPDFDTMLTQKVWLEHSEHEFLQKAIRH